MAASSNKRIIDPDEDHAATPDPKRPRIQLNKPLKVKCLKAILSSFEDCVKMVITEIDKEHTPTQEEIIAAAKDINMSCDLMSALFNVHSVQRQNLQMGRSNLIEKEKKKDFKVSKAGTEYIIKWEAVEKAWMEAIEAQGLEYKTVVGESLEWIKTIGLYMHFFCGFSLRFAELKKGHEFFPIRTYRGDVVFFPVCKYGLGTAHHVLLEGSTFPPIQRSNIVQWLGPMTAFLCMLKTSEPCRKKFELEVKRTMSHIPYIDNIIELTRTRNKSSDVAPLVHYIAEILLTTSVTQTIRMFFPVNFLYIGYTATATEEQDQLLDFFSLTGSGGFYLYKKLTTIVSEEFEWHTNLSEEMSQQMIFHCIFGTYNKEFDILETMTGQKSWFTRKDMRKHFRDPNETTKKVKLIPLQYYYLKMSCANVRGLLTFSEQTEYSPTVPCFSGYRIQVFPQYSFEQMERRRHFDPRSLISIQRLLEDARKELDDQRQDGKIDMGTAEWREVASLELGRPGEFKSDMTIQ